MRYLTERRADGLQIWQSYPGLFQQTFYWTDDNRLAITGGNQCITNTPSGPSYQPCGTGNADQGQAGSFQSWYHC